MSGKLAVFFVLIVSFSWARCFSIERVLKEIPERERLAFLKYYATKGYELERSKKFHHENLSQSDRFAIEMYYSILKISVEVPHPKVRSDLGCTICFSNGKCVDVCNPGVHPLI